MLMKSFLQSNKRFSNFLLDTAWGCFGISIFTDWASRSHLIATFIAGVRWVGPIAVVHYSAWATALHPLWPGWGGGLGLVNEPDKYLKGVGNAKI
jgi:hypothetical protein